MTKSLTFRKGGSSSKSPVRTPDTLISTDTVEVLLGVTEGPAAGLVDGPKTFYADGTSLVGTGGDTNFKNFALDIYPGSEAGHTLSMELGGFSNPINIGVNLASGVPVTRTGVVAGIDCIDFRVVVQQLLKNNEQGQFTNGLQLKFEVKKTTSPTWLPAWTSSTSTDPDVYSGPDGTLQSWSFYDRLFKSDSFIGDQQAITLTAAPAAPPPIPTQDATALVGTTSVSSVYHWDSENGTWAALPLTPTDPRYDTLASGKRIYKTSTLAPADARIGDMWYSPVGLLVSSYKVVVWNGTAWVKPNEFSAPPSPTTPDGVWSINEKTSNPTPKDIRIFLPDANPGDIWQYRVTKLSPDSTSTDFTEVSWESVQEINRSPMTFYGLAMARIIGRASDQFTSLPVWESDWKGRIVKVPTNYDPVTRVYTGVWDGTYKLAWTNCTAWIFQDFIENTRYGMSSVFPQTVNKWKIYEWAQVCDTMVLRPDGVTYRPRWTYNEWITSARDAKEMAEYIAGSAGAKYVDDGNGVVEVVIDKDDPAIAIFTKENVGDDGFSYSYTDRFTRANQITIEFINPDLNWGKDKRIVDDPDDIAIYGTIPENFIAVACTDVDEALARGRRRLIGGLTEKEMVTFSTNRKGRYLAQWDVILVGDEDMGRGITGRIRSQTAADTVELRDPVDLEPGIDYYITFDVVNPAYPATSSQPYKSEKRLLVGGTGPGITTLTFNAGIPDLPQYAAFAIEAPATLGLPKPYRITNIANDGGTGEKIVITALELNRNKYAYIDTAIDQGPIQYSNFQSATVDPASNPQIEVTNRLKGSITTRVARIFWDKSTYAWTRRYKVFHSINGAPAGAIDTNLLEVEFEGLENGIHTFAIVAIDIRGRESLPVNVSCNLTGAIRPVPGPTNLTLVGGTSPTVFSTLAATFAWDAAEPTPNFKNYQVQVIDVGTSAVVHNEDVGSSLTWTYNFYANKTDGGGTPRRNFKVSIFAIDDDLSQSPPVELVVNNPTPGAPTVTYAGAIGGVVVSLTPPTDTDVAAAYLWSSPTNGFNPAATAPTMQGNQSSFFLPLISGSSSYVRAAYYDEFSSSYTSLNYSSQITVTSNLVTIDDIDVTPPSVPAGLALTSTLTTNPDGTQVVKLSASWTAITGDASLEGYEIDVQEGAGNFVEFTTSLTTYEWLVKPFTSYTAKIRAIDRFGNRSSFSSTVSHTTTKDTTVPTAPTSVTALAAIQTGWLSWTNDSATDLARVEIWENSVNNSGTATRIATVNAQPSAAGGYTRSGLATGTTKYYWLKSVDTSGNTSGFSTGVSLTAASVTNSDIVVGSLTGDRITANTIAGDRFITNTSLPGTITVGVTGVTIGTIQTQANDPAARVNAQSTLINPGLILISGATTLASWRNGTDATKIEGGSIYANTIDVNKIKIGARGLSITGLEFSTSIAANSLSWSAGNILYTNDAGASTSVAISAGTTGTAAVITYIYWVQGATSLSFTTTWATANGSNNVVIATYSGGANYSATYGGTIIDGTKIVTGSITTTQLGAQSVNTINLAAQSVTATQLAIGSFDNLITNGDMMSGSLSSFSRLLIPTGSAISMPNSLDWPSKYALNITRGTTAGELSIVLSPTSFDDTTMAAGIPTTTGDEFYFEAICYQSAVNNCEISAIIRTSSTAIAALTVTPIFNTTASGNTLIANSTSTTFSKIIGTFKNNSGTGKLYFRVGNVSTTNTAYIYLWNVIVRRLNSTTLIQDGAITTSKIIVGTLNGDRIAVNTLNASAVIAGTVTADKLAIGSAGNMLANAMYPNHPINWLVGSGGAIYNPQSATFLGPAGPASPANTKTAEWALASHGTTWDDGSNNVVTLYQTNAPATDFVQWMVMRKSSVAATSYDLSYWPVVAGKTYEFSYYAQTSVSQCDAVLHFFNNAGTLLTAPQAGWTSAGNPGYGYDLSTYTRLVARGVAPAGATKAYLGIRKSNAGANSWVMLTRVQFSETVPNASQAMVWVPPGSTIIEAGNISTTSLSAISADLGAITAGSLNINNRFIVASDGTTTIQSSASGARLVMTNALIQVFDASNVERVRLGIW